MRLPGHRIESATFFNGVVMQPLFKAAVRQLMRRDPALPEPPPRCRDRPSDTVQLHDPQHVLGAGLSAMQDPMGAHKPFVWGDVPLIHPD
jgi:hypothetical protein